MTTGTAHGPGDDEPGDGSGTPPIRPLGARVGSRLPVLTAIADPVLEAQVVAALAEPQSRLAVVRRCVDLPDLLAAAATGTATVALASADLRRLDQEALARLRRLGLVVVGLNDDAAVAAERAEARLRQLGVQQVVSASSAAPAGPRELAARLAEAVDTATATQQARPGARGPEGDPQEPWPGDPDGSAGSPAEPVSSGRVVAVWGPTGAPGRSFLSWHLAGALAATGRRVLLVDADTYGGSLSQYAGVVNEAPGLVAACRAGNAGALDASRLAASAVTLPVADGSLTLLAGISRSSRWPEVRAAALERVLDVARLVADVVLVDCGFALEEDEELSYDTLAPQRNGATLTVLGAADTVLAVGSADPLGLTRLLPGLGDLREALQARGATPDVQVVANRVRSGGRNRRQVIAALERHGGVSPAALLPLDQPAVDRALDEGRPLCEAAPRSPLAEALEALAAALVPVARLSVPAAGSRRRRR